MAKKSFRQFVEYIASVVDDMEHKIQSDPKVRALYSGPGAFQEKVDRAISYWRSRPEYVDVNRAMLDAASGKTRDGSRSGESE